MFSALSNEQILKELGRRLEACRLATGLSDRALFRAGGVKKDALAHFKKGRPVSLLNFIKILRGVKLLDPLESLIPEVDPESPLAQVSRAPSRRPRRIRKPKVRDVQAAFRWGDE